MVTEDFNDKFEFGILNKNLSSPDRKIRQDALENLLVKCSAKDLNQNDAQSIYDFFYLSIFKCYADRFETCRSLACSIINELFVQLPVNDYYAEYIISMIHRRIGQPEIIEDSEEMRLQLLQQVTEIVRKLRQTSSEDPDFLTKCYNNIIDILIKTLRDPFRDIQLECCALIKILADATASFHLRADELVDPLIPMLEHRQSPNRRGAVATLGILALHIHSKGDTITKIITSISPLLMDPMPNVRLECGLVGCLWLIKLRDRYSFFERILPLILCCLKDDNSEILEKVSVQWKLCGIQFYEENEKELSELELVDAKPINYPGNIVRPTIGCRAIMERSIRMIQCILKEMLDWKEEVRFHSVKLLYQVILHSEKALTSKFIELFPILSKCCWDKEKQIVTEARKCARLLGNLLNFTDWINPAIDELKKSTSLGVLICFAELFYGADDNIKLNHLKEILQLLADPSKCQNLKKEYQNQLLELIEHLINLYLTNEHQLENLNLNESQIAEMEQLFYESILKIIALSSSSDSDVYEKGTIILSKLATTSSELHQFHGKYLKNILETIEDLDTENSERAEPIILLHGLLCFSGFQEEYLEALKTCIKMVLENGGPGAKIKILSGISISMLKWNETMDADFESSYSQLRKFFDDVIQDCLTWRAGRNSESIRAMATSVLCSMAQGASNESTRLFPNLATYFTQLVEDNNVVTRGYALKCLLKCGPIKYEQLRPLSLGVLARLDDPSSEVREYSTKIIGQLKIDPQSSDGDLNSWRELNKHILSVLLLHLDDPEINLQNSLYRSIADIAASQKKIFCDILSDLPKTFPYLNELNKIKENIEI